jgi:hypothetical protein
LDGPVNPLVGWLIKLEKVERPVLLVKARDPFTQYEP